MTFERRQTLRDKVSLTALADLIGLGGGTLLDLSEAGIGLKLNSPIPPREESASSDVRISLDFPATQTSIQTRGVIAWSDASGRAGVRFLNLTEGPRRLLREFLSLNAAA